MAMVPAQPVLSAPHSSLVPSVIPAPSFSSLHSCPFAWAPFSADQVSGLLQAAGRKGKRTEIDKQGQGLPACQRQGQGQNLNSGPDAANGDQSQRFPAPLGHAPLRGEDTLRFRL